jgi:hypothetical protein
MSSENKFIDGLIVKAPNERAPEYVKAKLSIKNEEMIAFLQARLAAGEAWTNADVKVSQNDKWYAALDEWKPNEGGTSSSGSKAGAPQRERPQRATTPADDFVSDDIPFITNRSAY